jgi:lipid II:glycine glycyltransferase (peptidoglycan interpeptide bridge formation enzyme)
MSILSKAEWESYTANFPHAHILQTAAWGELKSDFGWHPVRIVSGGCGAQILFRQLPMSFSLAYIPKGPLGKVEDWEMLWQEVDQACRQMRAVLLILEPDLINPDSPEGLLTPPAGFRGGAISIQPARTSVIDLRGDESELLARMKQKTRYNIRLAEKRGVRVMPSDDMNVFSRLMVETGSRDGFGVHSTEYYRRAYELFAPGDGCVLLLASYQGTPLAALMVFRNGSRAWYFYGASSDLHRELMPTYLLQWEAIKWAKDRGCQEYDLWGVPDENEETLENLFMEKSAGLWGVYRFKRGFGGKIIRSAGPWERIYNPLLFQFYRWWLRRRDAN